MRPAQKSNRSRGRGNRKGGGGGGGNNINRVFDSAGPEGKVRGTPQQIIDKYLTLARDAQTSGDRVTAENFLQHAEHYQRLLIQANQAQEQARREAQEAAEARQGSAPLEADGASTQGSEGQAQGAPDPASAPQPEIGGMAMIGDAESPLLMTSETASAPEKPSNGTGGNGQNRRRPRSKPEADMAEQQPQAQPGAEEAQAEGS